MDKVISKFGKPSSESNGFVMDDEAIQNILDFYSTHNKMKEKINGSNYQKTSRYKQNRK